MSIVPERRNERMVVQRSVFLLEGEDVRPIEDQLSENAGVMFTLSPDAHPLASELLHLAGADEVAFFPDLQTLAMEISAGYKAAEIDAEGE